MYSCQRVMPFLWHTPAPYVSCLKGLRSLTVKQLRATFGIWRQRNTRTNVVAPRGGSRVPQCLDDELSRPKPANVVRTVVNDKVLMTLSQHASVSSAEATGQTSANAFGPTLRSARVG